MKRVKSETKRGSVHKSRKTNGDRVKRKRDGSLCSSFQIAGRAEIIH